MPDLAAGIGKMAEEGARRIARIAPGTLVEHGMLDVLSGIDADQSERADLEVIDSFVDTLPTAAPDDCGQAPVLDRFLAMARRFGYVEIAREPREIPSGRGRGLHLRLRRDARPRWLPGKVTPAGKAPVQRLYAELFGKPMSDALWEWKYGNGRGLAVGVWEGGTLVAHYGGMTRKIRYFGRPALASQSGDVMVAPSGRGTLSRQGPLSIACATYLESQLGYGNPCLLGFGFPNQRAWKAPARLGFYGGPVGRMVELEWPALRGLPNPVAQIRVADLSRGDDATAADACWQAMADGLRDSIVGVRDAAYLRDRYLHHPDYRYLIGLVRARIGRRPVGVFVLRVVDDGCELLDLVASPGDMPGLIGHARRMAAAHGARRLFLWIIDNMADRLSAGATVRQLDIFVPANVWTPAPPVEALAGRWWLTGGDTDFH